jgi:hypothetical protein
MQKGDDHMEPLVEEKSLGNLDENQSPSSVFCSLSGGDIGSVIINSVSIPEVQSIRFVEDLQVLDRPPVSGYVDVVVFNEEPRIRSAIKRQFPSVFTLDLQNEYGAWMNYNFKNAKFTKRVGGLSVDDITFTERYYFVADAVVIKNGFMPDESISIKSE